MIFAAFVPLRLLCSADLVRSSHKLADVVCFQFACLKPCFQESRQHITKSGRTGNTVTDIVSPEKRSEMMSGIRAKNTKPDMRVRRALFSRGYRYRLHRRDLPGTPDIVLPGRRVAIFVHGCFWHRHPHCSLASIPSSRSEFWTGKFAANVARDKRNVDDLIAMGWTVVVLWECGLRRKKSSEDLVWLPRAIRTAQVSAHQGPITWP